MLLAWSRTNAWYTPLRLSSLIASTRASRSVLLSEVTLRRTRTAAVGGAGGLMGHQKGSHSCPVSVTASAGAEAAAAGGPGTCGCGRHGCPTLGMNAFVFSLST